jgi:hypothetical protein
MSGDFSRVTFDRKRHYSAVYLQQGRVITDADLNEEHDIQQYRAETTAADVIGTSGTPKDDPGFTLRLNAASQLSVGPGRFYVDGALFENEATIANATPNAAQEMRTQNASLGLVYLEGFRRIQTALEDPALRDPALNGPDTSVREQLIWQIKVLPLAGRTLSAVPNFAVRDAEAVAVESAAVPSAQFSTEAQRQARLLQVRRKWARPANGLNVSCQDALNDLRQSVSRTLPALTITTLTTGASPDPCDPLAVTNFLGDENQLYRLEIHEAAGGTNNRNGTKFKWSRENASVIALIESTGAGGATTGTNVSTSVVQVHSIGPDDWLSFKVNEWVEYVDDTLERSVTTRPALAQIDSVDRNTREIRLKSTISVNFMARPRLVRWDQSTNVNAQGTVTIASGTAIDLERNIQASFGQGDYRVGDYWIFPARASQGKVEFGPATPHGIRRYYAPLGVLHRDATDRLSLLLDCRRPLPALTRLAAEDVAYQSGACPDLALATTVQEALDTLCQKGSCTYEVMPVPGWEIGLQGFLANTNERNAHICFRVGEYPLPNTLVFQNKGHLKLTGSGLGTRIVAANSETALRFVNCGDVLLRDLVVESRGAADGNDLNGTLTFTNCEAAQMEHVTVQCAAAVTRLAACVRVTGGAARVQHSEFRIGHAQIGLLLVNATRAQINDNVLRVTQRATPPIFRDLVANPAIRAGFKASLLDNAVLGKSVPAREQTIPNVTLSTETATIHFRSPVHQRTWSRLLELNPPPPRASHAALLKHVNQLTDRILLGTLSVTALGGFTAQLGNLANQTIDVASQGIVVAGESAPEVRIQNNTIEGVMQGIHLGLSQRNSQARLPARHALIAGNRIAVVLPPDIGKRERHGIFAGNCQSLVIENNYVTLQRLAGAGQFAIDGIRVWGTQGERMLILQNHVTETNGNQAQSFNIGIRFNSLLPNPKPARNLWQIRLNTAPSSNSTVFVPANTAQPVIADNAP